MRMYVVRATTVFESRDENIAIQLQATKCIAVPQFNDELIEKVFVGKCGVVLRKQLINHVTENLLCRNARRDWNGFRNLLFRWFVKRKDHLAAKYARRVLLLMHRLDDIPCLRRSRSEFRTGICRRLENRLEIGNVPVLKHD